MTEQKEDPNLMDVVEHRAKPKLNTILSIEPSHGALEGPKIAPSHLGPALGRDILIT